MNTNIETLNNWNLKNSDRPIIIAGPCSAESEEQVIDTGDKLHAIGVGIFRAGIWKPRTRPGCFEGVGSVGLEWMNIVKKRTGMLLTTEVANVKHVYEALKAGIDILWIGARTTASPFAVQEIAEALKGVNIPVMVKNPVNPDIDLWYGAIERLHNSGITKIAGLHRGFSGLSKSKYRNDPHWQLPIKLRQQIKNIPILCDPSHIAGNRELIPSISQKAMDLNYAGLMIESHNNPDKALSDAKQQLTPKQLNNLLKNLIIRDKKAKNTKAQESLEELRVKIDEFDDVILEALSNRMEISKKIGNVKKENNINIIQANRWNNILKDAMEKAKENGLSEKFVSNFYESVHQESINLQNDVLNNS